ncbi:sensor histidine kinase [uncultured Agrococcus sp.]|uniref:sensor histidine kinase n=1 Tax=uncultured Agrococcus sp. TaxID=382258 RepID=UPI0025D19070|nr:sensor histidine kinase [uncultured Agrococcus sp.]
MAASDRQRKRQGGGMLSRLGRDYAYVLPGFFLSLGAFIVLVPLFTVGAGTLPIWVGAVILPFTLMIAGAFADLSRARLRAWGARFEPVQYRPRQPGLIGIIKTMADPRRWLDLLFETLIAFPLRVINFVLAVAWSALVLGGLSYGLWGHFVPGDDEGIVLVLNGVFNGALDEAVADSHLVAVVVNLVIGLIALVTLPFVMRGLAALDAVVTRAALLGVDGPPVSIRPTAETGASASSVRSSERTAERSSSMSPEGWAWIGAGVIAIGSLAIGWPVLSAGYGIHSALGLAASGIQAVAVLLAVRWPLAATITGAAAVTGTALLTAGTLGFPWPWPVMTMIIHFGMLLIITLRHRWPWALAAWGVGVLAASVAFLALLTGLHGAGTWPGAMSNMIVAAAIGLGVGVLGIIAKQLAVSRGQLASERQASSEQLAKRQELEERNRIAQELHDVVAHSMSVIGVQATTAKYRLEGLDERVTDEFDSIADSSRRALTEMRGLLALLRTGEDAPLAPQPDLAQIVTLIAATRRSGATIEFRLAGEEADAESVGRVAEQVPSATGLTAYRIVQEALSNALRHSPGADVEVRLQLDDDELGVEVANGAPADALAGQDSRGSGLGLAGIRSRVEALGGTVTAGKSPDGGYQLTARLPLG